MAVALTPGVDTPTHVVSAEAATRQSNAGQFTKPPPDSPPGRRENTPVHQLGRTEYKPTVNHHVDGSKQYNKELITVIPSAAWYYVIIAIQ